MGEPVSPNPCTQALADWCQHHPLPEGPIAVAFSAGADSTALLLAAHVRWPGRVLALHVHHGLQTAADGFEAQARSVCASLGVECRVAHVDARHASGQSPEDAARLARYATLAGLAPDAAVVLLGQHLDDQAETVLLALSRGAGLPGLAAMPEAFERHGMRFGRPLLGVTAQSLRDWLRAVGQPWVDDPSNQDLRLTRNRIRHQLMPAWSAAFPGVSARLARTAGHLAQAQRLLDDLAQIDLERVGWPPAIKALQSLTRERQANVLRYGLRAMDAMLPSAAQLEELLDQIADCTTRGHRIRIRLGHGWMVRDGAVLRYTPSV